MSKADLILTVTDRYNSEAYSAWFRAQGIPLVLTLLGRGTATTEILDYLSLEATSGSSGVSTFAAEITIDSQGALSSALRAALRAVALGTGLRA